MKKLEVGDIIKCVDDKFEFLLTYGKSYKVIDIHLNHIPVMITILNDYDKKGCYSWHRFEYDSIGYRNSVIEDILW